MKKSSSFRYIAVYVLAALVIVESAILLFCSSVSDAFAPTVSSLDDTVSWQTVTIGGIVTFEVPSTCRLGIDPKWINLVCPTEENNQPIPEMTFILEGDSVRVARYENLETPYWNHIVGSLKIIQPMTDDITINVQK